MRQLLQELSHLGLHFLQMNTIQLLVVGGALMPLILVFAVPPVDPDALQRLRAETDNGREIKQLFVDYKRIFNKDYKNPREELMRQGIFADKIRYIRRHNALYAKGEKSYGLGINKFTDITHAEFVEIYTRQRFDRDENMDDDLRRLLPHETDTLSNDKSPYNTTRTKRDSIDTNQTNEIPVTLDLRESGYVTSVKDQGVCGSCWGFSVVGGVEGQVFRTTGVLVSLSVQQLVDCDSSNDGCEGGNLARALESIKGLGGLQAEAEYPYEGKDNMPCRFNSSGVVEGSHVKRVVYSPTYNDTALRRLLAKIGPMVASMDINPEGYMSYSTGVFYEPNCSDSIFESDHAVLIVGYGKEPDDYWLIKNSMGTSWGDGGYMKIAMNKDNACGVTAEPMYPDVISSTCRITTPNIFYSALITSIVNILFTRVVTQMEFRT